VNWRQFLARNTSGSLTVEPQSSILYSTALLEYDDENNTAEATSNFFPAYELQDFSWSRMNLSDYTAVLCGTMLVGVGSPPVDSFSPMVIGIMTAGLGIPIVLLLVGGVYLFFMKKKETSEMAYEPIN
ncbi:hypothetical protein XENOCAPTIV_030476, partial [Xenoophorus captivus]